MRYNYEPTLQEIEILRRLHKPRGWKIVQSRRKDGIADFETRKIHIPWLKDHRGLYYFLHECGHVHTWALFDANPSLPNHVDEYRAEMYAIHSMRAVLIEPRKTLLVEARAYVMHHIVADDERGLHIDPAILAWAQGHK